jgi:hypothetical protein
LHLKNSWTKCPLDEVSLDEVGLDEVSLDEVGLDEVSPGRSGDEVGLDEVSLDEVGPPPIDGWRLATEEYAIAPANGIRGKGLGRCQTYITQDANLLALYNQQIANNHPNPSNYLRNISYHLGDYDVI